MAGTELVSEIYKDPLTGDLSEECEVVLPPPMPAHFNIGPANKMVKVRLIKLTPKRDLPFSAMAYKTEDTNTDVNPHPRLVVDYNLNCFQTDLYSKSRSLYSKTRSLHKDKDTDEDIGNMPIKPFQRHSLFQKRAFAPLVSNKNMCHTDDNVVRGGRIESDSRNLLKVSLDANEDSKTVVRHKLSSFLNSNNDSMKNNASGNTRSRNLSSREYQVSRDTNAIANSSKLLSDSMGMNRSILKPSRLQVGGSKSPGHQKVVRFSRLRTVIYFNMLHDEHKHKSSDINR